MDAQLTDYARHLLLLSLLAGFAGGVMLCWGVHLGTVAYAGLLHRWGGWRHRVDVAVWETSPEAFQLRLDARWQARADFFQELHERECVAEWEKLEDAWASSPEGRVLTELRCASARAVSGPY